VRRKLRKNKTPSAAELRPTDAGKVCYPTKTEAARAFIGANQDVIQGWGGLDLRATGGEFDSINERYELKGKRRAATLADAIWHALPSQRPYCLDRVDLATLNETRPAVELGAFRLPDVAAVARLERAERPAPEARGPRRKLKDHGPGYPLTGAECVGVDKRGRNVKGPCSTLPDGQPTGRRLYRPKLPGGSRPRVYLDEDDLPVVLEDDARDERTGLRGQVERQRGAGFDFGENPTPLTRGGRRSTMIAMASRDRHGRFLPRPRRAAKRNPGRKRRAHARRKNPMPETALLVNPSRRRRSSHKRRRNPSASSQLARMMGNMHMGKKRRGGRRRGYRRNPAAFGHLTLGHAGGAGFYGLAKNGIRRMYWMNAKDPAEQVVAIAKFNNHSPWIKAALVGAGWLAMKNLHGKWSDAGEGVILAGIADGLEQLTENIGLTPQEKSIKEAEKAQQKSLGSVLVQNRGLASVLVERERQLRAAGDDQELDALDPSDAFDDADELEDQLNDDDEY